jgi:hypothetical protein
LPFDFAEELDEDEEDEPEEAEDEFAFFTWPGA